MHIRRLVAYAIPFAALAFLMLATTAFGQPANPADITAKACRAGASWLDAILRAVVPWSPLVIVIGVAGYMFGREQMIGAFSHALATVGQTGMTVIIMASATTFGGLIITAANLPTCP
jgi:uncharacterized membrane protein